MFLQSLPVELLHVVAQDLDDCALAALAQTCSSLSTVAQCHLYRHLSVSAWSRNLDVVVLLATKPTIACHVRSFYIALESQCPVFASYYHLLAKAIYNMTGLISLDLIVDSSISWILRDACSRPSYPYLTHLTCSFPFDGDVVRFLRRSPSLLELEVHSIPTLFTPNSLPTPLPSECIPHLEQFIGSPQAARLVVPGRPVKSLHLHSGVLTEEDVVLLAQSTAPVLVLGAETNSAPVPFLAHLRCHLPHLGYLRVMTTTMVQPPSAVSIMIATLWTGLHQQD